MTELIGILNLTPDSFSDGGLYNHTETAITHAKQLIAEGATIIDVGAESTRPNATPLTHEEEWQKLEPVLTALVGLGTVSVDTYHPETASKALKLGISWINDVSGFTNPAMIEAVKPYKAKLVIMHNLGIPADPAQIIPEAEDEVRIVKQWAEGQIQRLVQAGIDKKRIIFDPGIGFGKNAVQSLTLLKYIAQFRSLNVPLMVGHSRKSCISHITGGDASARDPETIAISLYLAQHEVEYLRVHNIADHAKSFKTHRFLHHGIR